MPTKKTSVCPVLSCDVPDVFICVQMCLYVDNIYVLFLSRCVHMALFVICVICVRFLSLTSNIDVI